MVFNDKDIDSFLDNAISMASDDQLKKIELKGRQPSGEPQKQNPVIIEDSSEIKPIDPGSKNYKFKLPESEILLDNTNKAIRGRQIDVNELSDNLQHISQDNEGYRNNMKDTLGKVGGLSGQNYDSSEIDKKIDSAYGDLNKAKGPKNDLISQAILSFAPALFGAYGGEAAAISQLPAGQKARELFNANRKSEVDDANRTNEAAQKRYDTLLKMKQNASEESGKKIQRELDVLKTQLTGQTSLESSTAKDLDKTQSMINDIKKETSQDIQKGSKEFAESEDKLREANEKAKRANILATGQGFKDATTLRHEFLGLPEVKNFADVKQSYGKLEEMAKKHSAAGDMSMIFAYMKMLDPGSVVREGEQAQAENARGVPDTIRNLYNKTISGEKLADKQRKDFLARAKDIYNSQQKIVSEREKEYSGLGDAYGTKGSLVIPNHSKPLEQQPSYKDGDKKVIGGRNFIRRNGQWGPE